MLNIVIFGAPGSGKGTQAENILKKYQLFHISTGDLLRNEIANETQLGLQAKKFIDQGLLVPDEVVIGMISSKLDEHLVNGVKGVIFDGFPRTVAQAEALDKLLEHKNTEITRVISLEVREQELIRRILLRGKISDRSDDTNEEIIRQRIQEYNQKTLAAEKYYTQQKKFIAINGEGAIEEIFALITKEFDKLN